MSLTMKVISKENHFLGSQGHPFRISDHCLDFSSWTFQEQSALALPWRTCCLLRRTGCILCPLSQLRESARLTRYSQLKPCLPSVPPTRRHRHLTICWTGLSSLISTQAQALHSQMYLFKWTASSSSSGIYVATIKNMPCYGGLAISLYRFTVKYPICFPLLPLFFKRQKEYSTINLIRCTPCGTRPMSSIQSLYTVNCSLRERR